MIYYSLVSATAFIEHLFYNNSEFYPRRKEAFDIMQAMWDKSIRFDTQDRGIRLVSGEDIAKIMPEDVFTAFFHSSPIIYKIED